MLLEETVLKLLEDWIVVLLDAAAELSMILSIELDEVVELSMVFSLELVSAGIGGSQILSPEHADKAAIPNRAIPVAILLRIILYLYAIKPTPYFFTLRPDLPGGHVQSRQPLLA